MSGQPYRESAKSTTSATAPAVARTGVVFQATPNLRIASLDQFRGYTVLGMFVVNYLAGCAVTPAVLRHHHTYCSYADTIMPQFLFAAGFALRLTFGRREKAQGLRAAYLRVIRRVLGLAALSMLLYTLGGLGSVQRSFAQYGVAAAIEELCKRQWFQTLMHIAVTSIWILPVIRSSARVRAAFTLFSAGAHVALSDWFNFTWVNTAPQGIDGGPLGFLTWTIPAIVGTFACDAVVSASGRPRLSPILASSVGLMLLGYVLSCGTRFYDVPLDQQASSRARLADDPVRPPIPDIGQRSLSQWLAEPPFVAPPPPPARQWNYWMMSQRSGTLSYLTFSAGFALAVFALFHLTCDRLGWRLGVFRTLGTNALAAYILHGMLETVVKPHIHGDDWRSVAIGFAICFGCTYLVVRLMEAKRIHFRL
jgi:predicted acyltransferase